MENTLLFVMVMLVLSGAAFAVCGAQVQTLTYQILRNEETYLLDTKQSDVCGEIEKENWLGYLGSQNLD